MKVRIAVLDMDGTLFHGFLAAHMADALCRIPTHSAMAARDAVLAIDHYTAGYITHDECAALFYEAYGRAIHGLPIDLLRQLAKGVWRRNRNRLFPYAPLLARLVRQHGMLGCLISGSPEEVISLAAEDLRLDRWWGLEGARQQGICTGEFLRAPARRGGKKAVLTELATELDIDWRRSFAVGDSSADIEVLDAVGLSVAFEPDPELQQVARRRGWVIADRGNVLEHCRTLLADESATSVARADNQESQVPVGQQLQASPLPPCPHRPETLRHVPSPGGSRPDG